MLRKWGLSDGLRLGVLGEDQGAADDVDWVYGDASEIELLREDPVVVSGCR
jgi:hypothetical protein